MALKLLRKNFLDYLPSSTVYAHCDVPCGIYDPKASIIAAATVERMVELMEKLELPDVADKTSMTYYSNSMTRYILTKEEHAGKCKSELLILWTDYFKPEHLNKYPDLHDKFWKATKLCSKNKQEADMNLAKELVMAVDEIAHIFFDTKKA